jgi:hypothetical protein
VSPLPGLAAPNGGPDDPLPWCCSSRSAPSGAPSVEQLEATESKAWSSWRRSVTPAWLDGTEWRTQRPSALLLAVPDGGALDVNEWVDAGVGGCRSGGSAVLMSGGCRPKNRVAKKRRKHFKL